MPEPFVSVIVLTFNHERFVSDCLESILSQDYSEFEVIVSDDASTDSTGQIVAKYADKDPRLKFFSSHLNRGPAENFRFALNRSKGELIALCEGDDHWVGFDKISVQVRMMAEEEASLVYANYMKIDDAGKTIEDRVLEEQPPSFKLEDLIEKHGPATNSIIIKREALPDNLPRDFFTVLNPDVFIIGYGLLHGPSAYVDRVLSAHRVHTGGIWTTLERFEQGLIKYATLAKFYRAIGNGSCEEQSIKLLERQVILARKKNKVLFREFLSELPVHRRLLLGLKWMYSSIKFWNP